MSDDITARLRRVEDLLEIQQLCNEYGNLLDAGDVDAYAELFADDGEIKLGPVASAKGRAEIAATMKRVLAPTIGTTFHVISNPTVQLDGDTATTEVMWTMVRRGKDGNPELAMLGRHRDELVRERGRWRFKVRRGFIDVPTTYPGT